MEQQDQTAVKTEAWARILEQIEIFQVEMEKHGIKEMICHSASEGNFEHLSVFGCRHGVYKRLTNTADLAFGQDHFEKIRLESILKENDRNNVTLRVNREPSAYKHMSVQRAAMTLFDNIFEYVRASDDMDEKFVKLTSSFDANGGFNILMVVEDDRYSQRWPIPDVTNTLRQLKGWSERKASEINQDLTDRFAKILKSMQQDLERDYPGLGLTAYVYDDGEGFNDGIEFTIMHGETSIDPNRTSTEKLEGIYPGLFSRLQNIQKVFKSIKENIGIDGCSGIYVENEPIVESRAKPEMPAEPVDDGPYDGPYPA